MSAGVEHQKLKLITGLFPYQQPVWFYMAFPLPFAVAMKDMGMIAFRKSSVRFEQLDDSAELIHWTTPLNATFEVAFKLVGGRNLISHQIPIFLKNSSLLS